MKYCAKNDLSLFEFHDAAFSFVSFDGKDLVVSASMVNIHKDAPQNPHECDMEIASAQITFQNFHSATYEPEREWVTGEDGEDGTHQKAKSGHPALQTETDAHDQDGDEPDEDLVFSTEEGGSALCNGSTDLVDGFRAVRGVENLILFVQGHQERNNCGNRGCIDQDVHKPCFLSVCKQ